MDPKAFAFPATMPPACHDAHDVPFGLTKREYLAALALQGIVSRPTSFQSYEEPAEMAVKMADALIKQLSVG